MQTEEYDVVKRYRQKGFDVEVLEGGWRKDCFLLKKKGRKLVLGVVGKKKISRVKFLKSIKVENDLNKKGLPTRRLIRWGERDSYFWMVWGFIDGRIRWRWNKENSFLLGVLSRRLHQAGVCHMDIKPANVLWKQAKIVGVIDFEEARLEMRWQMKDVANSLSWLLCAGGDMGAFLKGLKVKNEQFDYARMETSLEKYLKKRVVDKQKNAFIILAKKRLEFYRKQVSGKMVRQMDLVAFRRKHKRKKIVFLVGAFELLHWGHLKYLKESRGYGDILVVGVASDKSRKTMKGVSFPLIGQRTRVETLAQFDMVDGVVVVNEMDVGRVIDRLKPNVVIMTKKDIKDGVRKLKEIRLVEELGGEVVQVDYCAPKVSSSKIIKMVALKKVECLLANKERTSPVLKVKNGDRSDKLLEFGNVDKWVKRQRKKRQTIGFVSLSADLFHLGHARFIQKAKSLVDVLVVATPSNRSIKRLKGVGRPIIDETARAKVLAELPYSDAVVIFDDDTVLDCLEQVRPDVFFTVKESWNQGVYKSKEAELVRLYGGKIVLSKRMAPYISASMMIDKAAGELVKKIFRQVLEVASKTPVINADFDPFDPANQLMAREKGFYDKVLEKVGESGKCVFCDLKDKYVIGESGQVVLTVALYPYVDGHLLIIPKRHVETMDDLTDTERIAVFELKKRACRLLKSKLGIENIWFLIREGNGIRVGKTVKHVHFHVLPYDSNVIKMSEVKLKFKPVNVARRLRK